jgi:hypothetical protein
MDHAELTVFTVADERYEPFVLPYLTTVLVHNPTARVEIHLERPEVFAAENTSPLGLLGDLFGDRVVLGRADFAAARIPNAARFLETPSSMAPYLYIGDIDIVVLEDIAARHLPQLEKTGLPYSNILRPGKPHLSGLHFTRWDARFPLPSGVVQGVSDEALLHDQVAATGPLPDPAETYRPIHGFHLSLNRDPRRKGNGWGGYDHRPYVQSYRQLLAHPAWQRTAPHFDRRFRQLLAMLETCLVYRHPDLMEGFEPTPGTDARFWW